jgi:HSP20 family protein
MSTRRDNLFDAAMDFGRQVEEAFSELIDRPWKRIATAAASWPAVDIFETAEAYLLAVDLPGVGPHEVELRVEPHKVAICGCRFCGAISGAARSVVVERTRGRFCRTFFLEHEVDAGGVETGYENGIYWAKLRKRRT